MLRGNIEIRLHYFPTHDQVFIYFQKAPGMGVFWF